MSSIDSAVLSASAGGLIGRKLRNGPVVTQPRQTITPDCLEIISEQIAVGGWHIKVVNSATRQSSCRIMYLVLTEGLHYIYMPV